MALQLGPGSHFRSPENLSGSPPKPHPPASGSNGIPRQVLRGSASPTAPFSLPANHTPTPSTHTSVSMESGQGTDEEAHVLVSKVTHGQLFFRVQSMMFGSRQALPFSEYTRPDKRLLCLSLISSICEIRPNPQGC